jgi:hypothetical protein
MVKMITHSSIINHVLIFLSLILVLSATESKKVGKEIFSCSPKSFTFRLDFDGQCPGNIASRQGIEGTDCFFIRDPKHTSPLVAVKSIQIIEVNLDLSNLSVKNLNGDFEDGYSWKYDSLTAGELSDKREVPGGIQLNIRGVDSDGNVITNSVIIDYSNKENAHQFLEVGDKIGWIVIVSQASSCAHYINMNKILTQNFFLGARKTWLPLVKTIVHLSRKILHRVIRPHKHQQQWHPSSRSRYRRIQVSLTLQ